MNAQKTRCSRWLLGLAVCLSVTPVLGQRTRAVMDSQIQRRAVRRASLERPPVPTDAIATANDLVAGPPIGEDWGEVTLECDAAAYPSCDPVVQGWAGGWVGGAEYLYARPSFSDGMAFVESAFDGNDLTQTRQAFDMDYQGSVRAFLGYRLCQCGGELMFTYTNLGGDTQVTTPWATATTIYTGQLEINAIAGERLASSAGVDLTTYDIDFAKRVYFGAGQAPCDSGCDVCPHWDLFWSAGVRIADIQMDYASTIRNDISETTATSRSDISLNGAGPRLGVLGRRYFGAGGFCSLFVSGDASLLLSDFNVESRRYVTGQAASTQVERTSVTRMVPVTEIEVGGACRVTPHGTLSAGYLFHAWYDMGTIQGIGGNLPAHDTANILSFDGLFVRGEWVY
jgi:hypothetical protein